MNLTRYDPSVDFLTRLPNPSFREPRLSRWFTDRRSTDLRHSAGSDQGVENGGAFVALEAERQKPVSPSEGDVSEIQFSIVFVD